MNKPGLSVISVYANKIHLNRLCDKYTIKSKNNKILIKYGNREVVTLDTHKA